MAFEFHTTKSRERNGMLTIQAESMGTAGRRWKLTVRFDMRTKKVIYPVRVLPAVPGMDIILDTDTAATCSLPPVVLDVMVDRLKEELGGFHSIVSAARIFIAQQAETIGKDTKNGR